MGFRDWIVEHRLLLVVVVVGALLSLGIVPYHVITSKARCRSLYADAATMPDTLAVDRTIVNQWNRFPGLIIRCEVFRRQVARTP